MGGVDIQREGRINGGQRMLGREEVFNQAGGKAKGKPPHVREKVLTFIGERRNGKGGGGDWQR